MDDIESHPLWPTDERLKRLSIPQRAALGDLIMDTARERTREVRRANLTRRHEERLYGKPSTSLPTRTAPWHDRVAKGLGIGASTMTRAHKIRQHSPDVFRRMQKGDFRSVEDAYRAAFGESYSPPKNKAGHDRYTLAKHLRPLNKYLTSGYREGAFNGMTPAEARRLLGMIRTAQYALIDIERALEERATVSRALA